MYLIGISGNAGSGKATLAGFLSEAMKNASLVTIGDLVKSQVSELGFDENRKIENHLINYRRLSLGDDYWINHALSTIPEHSETAIIIGITTLEEVYTIGNLGGVVVWVEADDDVRYQRIMERDSKQLNSVIWDARFAYLWPLSAAWGNQFGKANELKLSLIKDNAHLIVDNNESKKELEIDAKRIKTSLVETSSNLRRLEVVDDSYLPPEPWKESEEDIKALEKISFIESYLGNELSKRLEGHPSITDGLDLIDVARILHRPNLRGASGDQTSRRLSAIFKIDDPKMALKSLRLLKPSNHDEEYFSLLEDEEFYSLHLKIHLHWLKEKANLGRLVEDRLKNIRTNDAYQFSKKIVKSVSIMESKGVIFSINEECVEKVCKLQKNPIMEHLPILEVVKNDRIFKVSGFKDAKASLVVHDAIDHLWVFKLAEILGLFDKFGELFNSIGNPEKTDIYKREGEIVASISFCVRAFNEISPGFEPLVTTEKISASIRQQNADLCERHNDALRILNGMDNGSTEWRSLEYAFGGYFAELDEQRRKHGAIKFRNSSNGNIHGELNPFSLDYLCFFIELHHALLKPINRHKDAIFFVHYILEEYLRSLSKGKKMPPRKISLNMSIMNGGGLKYSDNVPTRVCEWMFRNYGFTANRNAV